MDSSSHATNLDSAALLRRRGLKATGVRLALLDALRDSHGPFTLEELHRSVGKERCDLVTMYRSLAAFQKARLVQRCDFGDGSARFEFRGDDGSHHHHVVCVSCRAIRPLDACLLEELERKIEGYGYQGLTHSLEFFGTCSACATAEKAAKH